MSNIYMCCHKFASLYKGSMNPAMLLCAQSIMSSMYQGAVKIHIYGALGKASGNVLQKKALDLCLSGAVRSQDLIYIPMAMATSGKAGAEMVFSWMQNEYSRIYEMIGATSMMLFQNMVRVSGAGFVTESKAEEVSAFWKSRDLYKNIEKALAQTVEGIKSNSKFVDRPLNDKPCIILSLSCSS